MHNGFFPPISLLNISVYRLQPRLFMDSPPYLKKKGPQRATVPQLGLTKPLLSKLKFLKILLLALGKKKKYVCLWSPDPPYFSAADPNLFYWQLFHPNFC
jgi:hypothetical protein